MIAISNEYTNEHGLPGYDFNPPKIQSVWRYLGMPCALGWISGYPSRQISRQFGGMPAKANL